MKILLHDDDAFPPVDQALEDGLLAIGGGLNINRLITAYRYGIFPWYNEGEPVCWFCPDPRFVLFPEELHTSKSLAQLLKKDEFHFTVNKNFSAVIRHCQKVEREGQDGTWITEDIINAYEQLHLLGYAHSAEVWRGNKLVGGLYGIRMGKVFFGESMFSLESNASKFAFAKWVHQLREEGVELIDCQVYTSYLESFGARMIPRRAFISMLEKMIG